MYRASGSVKELEQENARLKRAVADLTLSFPPGAAAFIWTSLDADSKR